MLAEGIRAAYADLFQINKKAHELSTTELRNKLKTLTQGQPSDSVLDKMAGTFKALAQQADFSHTSGIPAAADAEPLTKEKELEVTGAATQRQIGLGGLVYNIQLILPADRDRAVYDALFRSLKEHLLS